MSGQKSDYPPLTVHPHFTWTERQATLLAYILALLLGVGLTAYMFPVHAIFATDSLIYPLPGTDAAVHAVGQRYFVKDSWRWPLLLIKPLATPEGTNVAFTDSIPLMALGMKIFRRFLPPGFHSITLWLAICWIAQPVAAVFALRSSGERRLLPNFAVALLAASMPTLIYRTGHAALCSHFLILIAIGLYFKIAREATMGTLVGAGALILVALLVNPYIMYMVIAVLAAAPLTLLLRRDGLWIRVACGLATGVAIAAVVALLLGYGTSQPMPGFGYYSMNLLSPIYPSTSMIVPSFDSTVDATGGQYEGYQYLGVGLILLLLVADFCLGPRDRYRLLRRHAGLVLVCVALTLLALSNKIYAGHHLLMSVPAPAWLLQLRATGRFFWPVAYSAIIVGALIVCRRIPARFCVALLLVLASLQYVESSPMRRWVRRGFRNHWEWVVHPAELRPLLANHSKLIVWPKYGCGADQTNLAFSQLFLLASEVAIPVNTTYVGRLTADPSCKLPEFPISVAPSELWVFVPNVNPATLLSVVDWHNICRQFGVLVVCAQDLRGRRDLPLPTLPVLPIGKTLTTAANGPGVQWLGQGWSYSEFWGIWSDGPIADLVASVAAPASKDEGLTFTAWARGLGVHPSKTQRVTVLANGSPVAIWNLKEEDKDSEYTVSLPRSLVPDRSVFLEFRVEHPVSPRQDGLSADDRPIGMGLAGFRFDEQRVR